MKKVLKMNKELKRKKELKMKNLVAEQTVDLRIQYIGEIVYEYFSEMNLKLEKYFFFSQFIRFVNLF